VRASDATRPAGAKPTARHGKQYHEGQVVRHRGVLESLIAHHEAEASKLTEPKGAPYDGQEQATAARSRR
jgi:hypothetical protein